MALLQRDSANNDPVIIDLRQYLLAIINGWRLILTLATISTILAVGITLITPATYTATANITVPPDPTIRPLDTRQQAILALARSQPLLTTVYEQVQDQLTDPQDFVALSETASIDFAAEVLSLQVTWSEPNDATLITNEWANEVMALANELGLAIGNTESPEAKRAGADAARAALEIEQAALDTFMLESDYYAVRQELTATLTILNQVTSQVSPAGFLPLDPTTDTLANALNNDQLTQLQTYANTLQTRLWSLNAERDKLVTDRETAWRVYVNKDQEARNFEALSESNPQAAVVALPAVPPLNANPSNLTRTLLVAVIVGGVGGVAIVLVNTFRKSFNQLNESGISA